jgi:MHS family shikimate/dehydroshikimate transporter-like MFS transporter
MQSVALATDNSNIKSERGLASTIAASTIGTIVEWYDFLLYATAAR